MPVLHHILFWLCVITRAILYPYRKNDSGSEAHLYACGKQNHGGTVAGEHIEHLLIFVYDDAGNAIGMKCRKSTYRENVFDYFYYDRNSFGDIVGVYGSNRQKLAAYVYGAWGNGTVSFYNGGFSTGAQYNSIQSVTEDIITTTIWGCTI